MAMYVMIEKGLYRTPQQIEDGLKLSVYPIFQGKSPGYCTDKITSVIRSALPHAVRDMFSAKSLRQSGINKVSKHPCMTVFHLCALSGHSTKTTADSYMDFDDVGRPLPALNALHNKKNLFTPSVVPSLDALGCDKESALELMEEVFQCNIDKFAKGSELYVLKEIFLASLIMHHLQLRKDCGTANVVSSMLLDKAVDVGITCLDDNNGREPLRRCDQKNVFIHLVKNANSRNDNLQMLAAIHATAEAIGRGGEAKSQTYRDWEYDYECNVANTKWKEQKCTNAYAMPRIADKDWNRNWYLTMAM